MRDLDEIVRVNHIATHGEHATQQDIAESAQAEQSAAWGFARKYEAARQRERLEGYRERDARTDDPVTGYDVFDPMDIPVGPFSPWPQSYSDLDDSITG